VSSSQPVRGVRSVFLTLSHLFPKGFQSKQLIVDAGLTLGDVDQYPTIDVTLDGADEYGRCISELINP